MLFLYLTPDIESLGMELRNLPLNEDIQVLRTPQKTPLGFMLHSAPQRSKNCSDTDVHWLVGLIGSQAVFLGGHIPPS